MIELTPDDVAVILRLAASQPLDHLPIAQLNDEGQTEIVGWIETVGRMDDQLSPYAWYSLAEEAAASNDPEEPVIIEMLPTYTLSGDYETLELCRLAHFDWSIDAVPVEFADDVDELLDTGAPVRFLLLAEAGGIAFAKRACELCPELAAQQPMLTLNAIQACFVRLCESAGIILDQEILATGNEATPVKNIARAQLDAAIAEGNEAARNAMLSLDPEPGTVLRGGPALIDLASLKIAD